MRKRHSKPRGDEQDSIYSSGHLTDEALLRSLDGELSLREALGIDAHVRSCWSCRSRKQAIADSITDLVDYENAMAAPFLPPSLDQRAIFLARLDAAALEMGHPSRLKGWLNRASQVFKI